MPGKTVQLFITDIVLDPRLFVNKTADVLITHISVTCMRHVYKPLVGNRLVTWMRQVCKPLNLYNSQG